MTNGKRFLAIGVLCAACVSAIAIVFAHSDRRSTTDSSSANTALNEEESDSRIPYQVRQLERELALLRTDQREDIRELKTEMGTLQSSHDQQQLTEDVSTEDETQDSEKEDSLQLSGEAYEAEAMRILDESLEQEPPDPEWSMNARDELLRAYETDGFEQMTAYTVCAASMCRVDFDFEPTSEFMALGDSIVGAAPWRGKGFIHVDGESGQATYYLAREGYDLPTP